jgi:hypothetical protein
VLVHFAIERGEPSKFSLQQRHRQQRNQNMNTGRFATKNAMMSIAYAIPSRHCPLAYGETSTQKMMNAVIQMAIVNVKTAVSTHGRTLIVSRVDPPDSILSSVGTGS